MARSESVILALGTFGKTADSAVLAKSAEFLLTPGQKLMRVRLVADIPYEAVMSGIKYIMKGYRQFNTPRLGARWPPVSATVPMIRARISSANSLSCSWDRPFSL